ncbi:MAG: phosphate acyltransferase PlsX [Eubacteriales bacterium]
MKIYVDGMGGDHAPYEIVKGCLLAAQDFNKEIFIIGHEEKIRTILVESNYNHELIHIIPCTEGISNDEDPTIAIRKKKNSSIVLGMKRIKEDKKSVFVSAGSTGALLAGGLLLVGRIKGIQRPALTVMLPTKKGFTLLLDAGANADCKASYLKQFAIMGGIYAEHIMGISSPKIGLVNIGSEEKKGNELTKETYALLKDTELNFIGNIEGRDVVGGLADVLVADGFTGNTVLKVTEGVGQFIMDALKESLTSSARAKLGALLLKPSLRSFKKRLDYKEVGGAPLLGINGGIIKAHGSSDHKAMYNAIKQAVHFAEKNILEEISHKILESNE